MNLLLYPIGLTHKCNADMLCFWLVHHDTAQQIACIGTTLSGSGDQIDSPVSQQRELDSADSSEIKQMQSCMLSHEETKRNCADYLIHLPLSWLVDAVLFFMLLRTEVRFHLQETEEEKSEKQQAETSYCLQLFNMRAVTTDEGDEVPILLMSTDSHLAYKPQLYSQTGERNLT